VPVLAVLDQVVTVLSSVRQVIGGLPHQGSEPQQGGVPKSGTTRKKYSAAKQNLFMRESH
jgi:hypothetical protein